MAGISKAERDRRAAEAAGAAAKSSAVDATNPPASGSQGPEDEAGKAAAEAAAQEAAKKAEAEAAAIKKAEEEAKAKAAGKIKTVRMTREEPMYPKGKTTADVHPAEVENMKAAGWREA